jgi:hypothetical protein
VHGQIPGGVERRVTSIPGPGAEGNDSWTVNVERISTGCCAGKVVM